MTQEQHPIIPPSELVQQWITEGHHQDYCNTTTYCIAQAARWGADQELEACCVWLEDFNCSKRFTAELRAARRPKPPSLKQQALQELDLLTADATTHGLGFDASAIRRALESIPDEQ